MSASAKAGRAYYVIEGKDGVLVLKALLRNRGAKVNAPNSVNGTDKVGSIRRIFVEGR